MGFWQITYHGVTKDAAAWGISNLRRQRWTNGKADTVTFKFEGMAADVVLPFAFEEPLAVKRDGVPWFAGWVTKAEASATGQAEDIYYEVSNAWYWLENIVFQQMWVNASPASQISGHPVVTTTSAVSEVILGQSLDGIKIDSGQVMKEVLYYAQYAFQGIPFPNVVDVNHLPAQPSQVAGPFRIGALTPSILIPYSEVRDKSCADLIRLLMKYTPDAVATFDYSTTPATLNINRRGNLKAKTIRVFSNTVASTVSGFNATPRNDLQVPGVIAKFRQTNSINGQSYTNFIVQKYPPMVADNAKKVWVQTVDLAGGEQTIQTADIGVIARPIAYGDSVALNWAIRKVPLILGKIGTSTLDLANIQVNDIRTTIDPNDPLTAKPQDTTNPNNITFTADGTGTADCPQLVNELTSGEFPSWLQGAPNDLDAAKVKIEVILGYIGSDPATAAKFVQNPASPYDVSTNLAPGTGSLIFNWHCTVTNADTELYTELLSSTASEPVPAGFAQYLFEALAPLYFSGDVTITEVECSDQLPVGCVFNTVDGNAAWQTMNALVLSVSENVDMGITKVTFGPPQHLGLDTLSELFRANLGREPTYRLDERTTGKSAGAGIVGGVRHTADAYLEIPLGGGTPSTPPAFAGISAGTATAPAVKIKAGSFNGFPADPSTLGPYGANDGDTYYVTMNWTYDLAGNITATTVTCSNAGPAGTVVVPDSSGITGGSGQLTMAIFVVHVEVVNGISKVSFDQLVSGSQVIWMCNDSIQGPLTD